jgi:hypothetical protein
MLRLVMIGAFGVGAFGILAWLIATVAGVPGGGSGNCNIASGGIGSGGNKLNCDFSPPVAPPKP